MKNNGPDTATNLIVTDTLRSGLTYVSSTLGGSYNALTRTITWNLASLASGNQLVPSFRATVGSVHRDTPLQTQHLYITMK